MKNLFSLGIAFLSLNFCFAQEISEPKESWLTKSLAEKGTLILQTKDIIVWGCAPIYDDQGKLHVYYSTWAKTGNWLTHSNIAHAVSDKPEGPYERLGIILKGRKGKWDAHTIHNPNIQKVDGKYVMLYIGNDTIKQDNWRTRGKSANTQRVGMAIADIHLTDLGNDLINRLLKFQKIQWPGMAIVR